MDITLQQLEIVPADHAKYNITNFDCGHADLNDFIRVDCPRHISQRLSFTRLALHENDIVGYISLLADSIALHITIREWFIQKNITIQQVPALKIGRLGIENKYKGRNIGTALMKYAVGVAFRMNDELGVGCRFLTVDSDQSAVGFYMKMGFVMNLHRDYKGRKYPSMHYDIVSGPPITG
ncbi:MAG: GNAT family N-acetyltransferase [Candidatus Bathyarchaeia archaeon]